MNSSRYRRWINALGPLALLAALLVIGCEGGTDRAAHPRMNRLDLVGDADVVVHCSDTRALAEAVGRSPLGRFWNGPEMKAFRAGWRLDDAFRQTLLEEMDGEHAAQMRDIYQEQLKMLDGEIALGLDCGDFRRQPAITLAAAMREADYRRSLELDALLFELEAVETVTASEDFRGATITTYLRKEAGGDRFLYQAFQDGTLLASEDRQWLEQALIRLMATPAREPEGDPVLAVTGTVRLMDRLQTLLADKAAQNASPVDPQTVMHGLGLDTVGDLHMEAVLKQDRADLTFSVARRGEWNRGLMVLLPAEPAPLDFRLAHVPPDVASYQVFRLDLDAFWQQIPQILGQISADIQMQFSMGVNAAGGMMDINLNDEIFGNLEPLGFTYARIGDAGQEMVYGFRVKDAGAMTRTLEKLFAEQSPLMAQLGNAYRRTDIQGHILHMLQYPVPSGDGQTTMREVGITVIDRALVIGEGGLLVDYVQAAVNNAGEPEFYTSPMFTRMVAHVPAGACSYGVSDLAAYAGFFVDQVRTTAAAMQTVLATPASAGGGEDVNPMADLLAGFDIAKLPAAESVGAYFATSDGFSLIDAGGFRSHMTVYYPQP
jgi:hypothetical protein